MAGHTRAAARPRRWPTARRPSITIPPRAAACSSPAAWGSPTTGPTPVLQLEGRAGGSRRGAGALIRAAATALLFERPDVAGPQRAAPRLDANVLDPALSTALASAAPTTPLEVIVNYDETVTTRDAVTNSMLNLGAGVVQFKNLELVAGVATPAQINAIAALPGVQSVYLNRQLQYYGRPGGAYALLHHESVPTIRADAVQAIGITGKGMGIAILDSGIDGLYNPDLVYPTHTVQNVKVIFNLSDVVTFKGPAPKPLKQGVDIFAENLPNSETSVGHGTHVAGITAALGTASGGYYTGVAPGANVVGVRTGDVLFIFFALAGFDYILDHQAAYNIKVVNNSWR